MILSRICLSEGLLSRIGLSYHMAVTAWTPSLASGMHSASVTLTSHAYMAPTHDKHTPILDEYHYKSAPWGGWTDLLSVCKSPN